MRSDSSKTRWQFGYLLQDLLAKAEAATKKGDHLAAARYYTAIAKGVPSRSYAFAKLCESLQAAGDRGRAVGACRSALYREGATVADYLRFVNLALAKDGPLTPDERKELEGVAKHLAGESGGAPIAERMRCEIALRVHDVPALESCTAALGKLAPNDSITISFQWALALEKRDRASAERLIERARAAGMAADGLAKMESATGSLGLGRGARATLWGFGGIATLLLLVVAARRIAGSRRRYAA